MDGGRCRGVGVRGCRLGGVGIEKEREFLVNIRAAEEGSFDCPGGNDDGLWVGTATWEMEEDADAIWDDLYELTMDFGVVHRFDAWANVADELKSLGKDCCIRFGCFGEGASAGG